MKGKTGSGQSKNSNQIQLRSWGSKGRDLMIQQKVFKSRKEEERWGKSFRYKTNYRVGEARDAFFIGLWRNEFEIHSGVAKECGVLN